MSLTLADRKHRHSLCGLVMKRCVNAARIIVLRA